MILCGSCLFSEKKKTIPAQIMYFLGLSIIVCHTGLLFILVSEGIGKADV